MTPSSTSAGSPGLLAAWRALGDGLLATAQTRLALFSTELHEEKFRLVQTFLWVGAILVAMVMTVAFASLTLVYLFPASVRLAVLGGLTVGYGVTLLAIVFAFRRHLARQPRPFAATLEELHQDRTCIPPES